MCEKKARKCKKDLEFGEKTPKMEENYAKNSEIWFKPGQKRRKKA